MMSSISISSETEKSIFTNKYRKILEDTSKVA